MDTQPENLDASGSSSSKRDFWIGFIGWFVVNVCVGAAQAALFWGLGTTFLNDTTGTGSNLLGYLSSSLGCLVFLANIGALIFFAFRRKQIALGMLVAFGVSIAISLLLGVIAMIACFVIIGQYNNL